MDRVTFQFAAKCSTVRLLSIFHSVFFFWLWGFFFGRCCESKATRLETGKHGNQAAVANGNVLWTAATRGEQPCANRLQKSSGIGRKGVGGTNRVETRMGFQGHDGGNIDGSSTTNIQSPFPPSIYLSRSIWI